jgi:hypothetical protein
MACIAYEKWTPGADAWRMINNANRICADYESQGYDLTLRQLYYQFVSEGLIPNTQRSYKQLGDVVNHARNAGYMDWDYIVDRTRNLKNLAHWSSPSDIVEAISKQFRIDHWNTQPTRVEIWVEKEALAGVIERTANRNDVSWFSCRGYVSQSEMWSAAQRIGDYIRENRQNVIILHLGDHDPSGIDMTRDITDRLKRFIIQDYRNWVGYDDWDDDDIWEEIRQQECNGEEPLEVRRIALNMDQVNQYNPPPNPAKITDSRARGYIALYGNSSWELDALNPAILDQLIQGELDEVIEELEMETSVEATTAGREKLAALSSRWRSIDEKWDEMLALLDA